MTQNKVIRYNSWTDWSTSNIPSSTILYSGPTIKCPIEGIYVKNTTVKYIIVLK